MFKKKEFIKIGNGIFRISEIVSLQLALEECQITVIAKNLNSTIKWTEPVDILEIKMLYNKICVELNTLVIP